MYRFHLQCRRHQLTSSIPVCLLGDNWAMGIIFKSMRWTFQKWEKWRLWNTHTLLFFWISTYKWNEWMWCWCWWYLRRRRTLISLKWWRNMKLMGNENTNVSYQYQIMSLPYIFFYSSSSSLLISCS